MRRRHHYEADEAFDERGILKDGHSCRVSLMDSDSLSPMQRDVARSSVQVVDGQGGTQGLSRPGWRLLADAQRSRTLKGDQKRRIISHGETQEEEEDDVRDAAIRDARSRAYHDYETELAEAYKNPVGLSEKWRRS
jgi:hypothetical protein